MTKKTAFYIYPWKRGSESAKALAEALGGKLIKREGSKFEAAPHRKVINWGSSDCPYEGLNLSDSVKAVSNKLFFFRHLKNLQETFPGASLPRVPRWTESLEEAQSWKKLFLARTVLNGHSGEGIVFHGPNADGEPPQARLYVEYIDKESEYRVHVFNGQVIDVQRKIRDPEREPTDWKIRSHSNGFIYARSNPEGQLYRDIIEADAIEQSKRAVACCGLGFAGVDVVVSKKGQAFILELNTAVGLEGETVNVYKEAIKKYFNVA